ncbi:TonB family protein [Porticoccaceae bacterium]|nr:TonB family protein [Porticoccaceae bacterium]
MNIYSHAQLNRSTGAVGLRQLFGTIAGLMLSLLLIFSSGAQAELKLNGSAIYQDLGKQQFVAALFVDDLSNNANSIQLQQSPKRMEVRIINDYSKRRWLNLWMQSISINNDRESFSGSAQEVIDIMRAPKSAPKRGDVIEYLFDPELGTSVRFNGTELIANYPPEVFNILLRTWIGPIPPSTAFKAQLLGDSIDMDADELLNDIQPQSSRIALAASWMAPAPEVASSQPEAELALEVPKENPEAEAEMAAAETTETDAANQLETEKTDLASSVQAKAEPLTDSPGAEQKEEIADFNLSEALAQRDYTPLVVAQIYKAIRYPNRAADKNQQGTVRIGVTINRSGKLVSAITTQESKYRLLNQAALKAVKKAAPFPELPEEMKADSFEVNLPITFRLQ